MNLNRLRLKAVWLLVIPFFWFARPSVPLLAAGALVAALGLGLRAWAAGTIHKEEHLTTSGPYAHTRNPLYLGSFFIGIGVTLAGGSWIWTALFAVFYGGVYARTMTYEAGRLQELFGERYLTYAGAVPAFLPRLTPYEPAEAHATAGFTLAQYQRNREWEALLGALAAFALLAVKTRLGG